MHRLHGLRARLSITLVALVATTAILLGVGSYLFVDRSLHQQLLDTAADQAGFDLTVTVPEAGLPLAPTKDDIIDSGLLQTFQQREIEAVIDLGSGGAAISNGDFGDAQVVVDALPPELTTSVAAGQLAYAWTTVGTQPSLVIGGHAGASALPVYFIHDATTLRATLDQLRLALIVGTIALILVALLVARSVARGVLAPVDAASRAAERIEGGDLSARVPVTSDDEFGEWAERFNRMAAALGETIGRLEAAEAQNRRFVSDVAHELRTPLAALVAEASILQDHLDALPDESRRAGELLIADVARLRALVSDLMEISRFDAGAEHIALEPVDIGRFVTAVAAARFPTANVAISPGLPFIDTDPRRLERILGNLLDNAREHAAGTPVDVDVAVTVDSLVISVADRGPGVPPERMAHIFERFYKADPSRHAGSSGLGLAIALEHAELLGGTLEAEARDGGGLRMELRLPVTGSLPPGDEAAMSEAEGMTDTDRPQELIR
jgi:two-component system sensor histidine kinase MtrB